MSIRVVPLIAHPRHPMSHQVSVPIREAEGGKGLDRAPPIPWPNRTDTKAAELPASCAPAQLSVGSHLRSLRKLPFHRPQELDQVKPQQTDGQMGGPVSALLLPPWLSKCLYLVALLRQPARPHPSG